MAFWLIRGLIALVAVVATLVPAGVAVDHGWDVMQAQAEQQERQTDAHQELLIFQAEIQQAENEIRQKPTASQNTYNANVASALHEWSEAADDWRAGDYRQMADHITTGRGHLLNPPLINEPDQEAFEAMGWQDGPGDEPTLRMDMIVASLAIAALFWTVWGGISQRVQQAVPVPVFPGEVEIERPPESVEDEHDPWFTDKEPARPKERRRGGKAGAAAPDGGTDGDKPGHRPKGSSPERPSGPSPSAAHRPKVVRKVKANPLPPVDEDHDDDPVTPS